MSIPHPKPRLAKKGCLSGHFVIIRCFTHGEHDNFMTWVPRFLPRRRERRAGQLVRTHAAKNVARCDTLSGLCRAHNAFRHLLRVAEIPTKPLRRRNCAAANCMLWCIFHANFDARRPRENKILNFSRDTNEGMQLAKGRWRRVCVWRVDCRV